jgi:PHD/YefM family antitoxin component YafN of YafNO toxin-antitoxin module
MKKKKQLNPELIVSNGKPKAVILDIAEYRNLLERLDDMEDLALLEEMSGKKLKFTKLEDFLREN